MPSTRSSTRGNSPTHSHQSSPSRSRAASAAPTAVATVETNGTSGDTTESSEIVLSETLDIGDVFPFFILAFAALGAGFVLTAWSAPRVKSDWSAVPVLILGISAMLLSPLIGYSLSLGVWKVAGKAGPKLIATAIGCVFIAALVHQNLEIKDLQSQLEQIRGEISDLKSAKQENPLKKLGINW
jgi:hypothetical protein